MNRVNAFFKILDHYKYLIVIVVGTLLVGFVDENSYMHRMQLNMKINDLKSEISKYEQQNEADTKQLMELSHDPKAVERIARERYFMKTDDEDIYVLSETTSAPVNTNEATQ